MRSSPLDLAAWFGFLYQSRASGDDTSDHDVLEEIERVVREDDE